MVARCLVLGAAALIAQCVLIGKIFKGDAAGNMLAAIPATYTAQCTIHHYIGRLSIT